MRQVLSLLFCFVFVTIAYSQEYPEKPQLKPYYKRPGSMAFHFSNFMFPKEKPVIPPLNFHFEFTAFNNVTFGPVFTFFQFKHNLEDAPNATRWVNSQVRYNQYFIGLKGHYHLNDIIEKLMKRPISTPIIDVYVSGWLGYSIAKSNYSHAEQNIIDNNYKIRGGAALGVRSMVFKWLGFSLEAGYSSYGYGSFGITFVLR